MNPRMSAAARPTKAIIRSKDTNYLVINKLNMQIIYLMKMLLNSPGAAYSKQVYNIVPQHAISSPLGALILLFLLLPRDQSRDVTPRLGVFVVLHCTSFRVCIFIPATIITTT